MSTPDAFLPLTVIGGWVATMAITQHVFNRTDVALNSETKLIISRWLIAPQLSARLDGAAEATSAVIDRVLWWTPGVNKRSVAIFVLIQLLVMVWPAIFLILFGLVMGVDWLDHNFLDPIYPTTAVTMLNSIQAVGILLGIAALGVASASLTRFFFSPERLRYTILTRLFLDATVACVSFLHATSLIFAILTTFLPTHTFDPELDRLIVEAEYLPFLKDHGYTVLAVWLVFGLVPILPTVLVWVFLGSAALHYFAVRLDGILGAQPKYFDIERNPLSVLGWYAMIVSALAYSVFVGSMLL